MRCGSIAQLGEHLPYKQRVTGSSPVVPIYGSVVQLVRTPPCHGGGRGFESHPSRISNLSGMIKSLPASVAQLVEQGTENPRVVGSIPIGGICGFSSFGRAPPCQGGGGGFEPRNPLKSTYESKCFFLFHGRKINFRFLEIRIDKTKYSVV